VTLNGSTIAEDRDANGRFYGTPYTTRQIVFEHLGGVPEPVPAWRAALTRYASPR
jgi:lipid-binding SYLF domain-containing protein